MSRGFAGGRISRVVQAWLERAEATDGSDEIPEKLWGKPGEE